MLASTESEENCYYTTTPTISTSENYPCVNVSSECIFSQQQYCEQMLDFQADSQKPSQVMMAMQYSALALRHYPRNLRSIRNVLPPSLSWQQLFRKPRNSGNSAFVGRKEYLRRRYSLIFSISSTARLPRFDSCLQTLPTSEHQTKHFLYSVPQFPHLHNGNLSSILIVVMTKLLLQNT